MKDKIDSPSFDTLYSLENVNIFLGLLYKDTDVANDLFGIHSKSRQKLKVDGYKNLPDTLLLLNYIKLLLNDIMSVIDFPMGADLNLFYSAEKRMYDFVIIDSYVSGFVSIEDAVFSNNKLMLEPLIAAPDADLSFSFPKGCVDILNVLVKFINANINEMNVVYRWDVHPINGKHEVLLRVNKKQLGIDKLTLYIDNDFTRRMWVTVPYDLASGVSSNKIRPCIEKILLSDIIISNTKNNGFKL